MLLAAAEKYNIDLTESFMVGDDQRDIDCALAAGVTPIHIDRDYADLYAFVEGMIV
jgi:D-glycero-D-manno-heptose 1,7-bisphosphate phosphatase